ncbi:MAG: S9 family peptidase [Pseudomonadota bacterium]
MDISPDGKHYAFIKRADDGATLFVVFEIASMQPVAAIRSNKLKARDVRFVSNRHVVLTVSETRREFLIRDKWESSSLVAFDIQTQKQKPLPYRFDNLFPAQSGLGRLVGITPKRDAVFMPAFVGSLGTQNPRYSLLRVALDTGRARVVHNGTTHTIDWFVGRDGRVLAREDFNNDKDLHQVLVQDGRRWRTIYEDETDIPRISLRGSTADGAALVFTYASAEDESLYYLSLKDGSVTGPFHAQTDRDIDRVLTTGIAREYLGIQISGPKPIYLVESPELKETLEPLLNGFEGNSVFLVATTSDWSKIIVRLTGNSGAHDYLLYTPAEKELVRLARGYPNINVDQIGEIQAIRYAARDGTKIPAVLTWPVGVKERNALPTLVFPHGGPESYDRVSFDWWAQYFARRGYLVLQPNFRGSSGHGFDYRHAGRGQWGQIMQDDVSDGLAALVKAGYTDPTRVCIMGASYGGYSALAGGAYTPELYRCVISVAGVSDLPKMLRTEAIQMGRDHWVVSYWQQVIGNSRTERERLKSVSPVNAADQFAAPVLLIHGKDDTVVPINQSLSMTKALKRAGKTVQLVKLAGEDHWLSRSATRLATLEAIADFLQMHNPADPQGTRAAGDP